MRGLSSWLVLVGLLLTSCSGDASSGDGGSDTTGDAATTTAVDDGAAREPVDQTPPATANGVKIDPDGMLWIASVGGDELVRVDPDTGEILQRLATPAGAGPDDVVLADDGTVYWTGFLGGQVGAADPTTGEVTTIAELGPDVNPIARRDDGTLVVGKAVGSTGLFAVRADGSGEPETLADPGNVNSFSLAGGVLYAPLGTPEGGSVVAIDPGTGDTIETIAEIPGIPVAARWHDGTVYVLTLENGARIRRVPATGGTAELFADVGLEFADNLVLDETGTVYVTGFRDPVVVEIDPDGDVVGTTPIGG